MSKWWVVCEVQVEKPAGGACQRQPTLLVSVQKYSQMFNTLFLKIVKKILKTMLGESGNVSQRQPTLLVCMRKYSLLFNTLFGNIWENMKNNVARSWQCLPMTTNAACRQKMLTNIFDKMFRKVKGKNMGSFGKLISACQRQPGLFRAWWLYLKHLEIFGTIWNAWPCLLLLNIQLWHLKKFGLGRRFETPSAILLQY